MPRNLYEMGGGGKPLNRHALGTTAFENGFAIIVVQVGLIGSAFIEEMKQLDIHAHRPYFCFDSNTSRWQSGARTFPLRSTGN